MTTAFFRILVLSSILSFIFSSCERFHNNSNVIAANQSILDTAQQYIVLAKDSDKVAGVKDSIQNQVSSDTLNINKTQGSPETLVAYAMTLEGAPYLYGSQDPEKGFDNSGFVNY